MSSPKVSVGNKKAFHDYHIGEKFEAGLSLLGSEVKALRAGKGNLTAAWVDIAESGVWLREAYIGQYVFATVKAHHENRPRPLLLNKNEIKKIRRHVEQKGATVIPTRIYLKGSLFKIEIGLGKGKKSHDKREAEKSRDAKKQIDRAMKSNRHS